MYRYSAKLIMRVKFLLILLSIGFYCCSNINQKQQIISKRIVTANFLAFTKPDSSKKAFTWEKMNDLNVTAGGSVVFIWQKDSTMECIGGRNGTSKNYYTRFPMSKSQAAKVPLTLLNDKYKLIGVFEQNTDKRSGYYFAYYVNGNNLLVQLHETIGFVVDVMYYSDKPLNEFEKAGFVFPYKNNIRF